MIPNFFFSDGVFDYGFGESHPLKPERMRRTLELLGRYGLQIIDAGTCSEGDLRRMHDTEYIDAVRRFSDNPDLPSQVLAEFGFGRGDNPAFAGMWEASLAYCAGTVRAAEAVRDGERLAFGLGGGLHHAHRRRASGFCIFDDPAIACAILLERFDRVAYVDIDVHHGDGVQWLLYDDPRVLTCSIHESGRTLYPGTGFVDETGAAFTSLNVPMAAKTPGTVWLDAFRRTILPALHRFKPGAIVLQMGTDTHRDDPLGHLRVTQQEWLTAVTDVAALDLPLVAVGGGGYNLQTVPRMWASAVLSLSGVTYEDTLPADLATKWGTPTFSDPDVDPPTVHSRMEADQVVAYIEAHHLANLG